MRRVKEIAVVLLGRLKAEKLRIQNWRDKDATSADVRTTVYNFLFSEQTDLPLESYEDDEIEQKSEETFTHLYQVYPTIPLQYYARAA